MDKIATENLFLLEFLVDKVLIDPALIQDYGDPTGDTCLSVQFLDNVPLDICENDFTPTQRYSRDGETIKSGKSCMFSLTPEQATLALKQFDVYVDVFKKINAGAVPEKIQVGHSLISIVNLFQDLLTAAANISDGTAPTAKTLKDTYKITNAIGQYIGDICMYVRISCFGKLIVTQFQMNLEDRSVLFKDKEGHSLYRYKKADAKPSSVTRQETAETRSTPCKECSQEPSEPVVKCPEVPCAQLVPQDPPCNTCVAVHPPLDPNPPGCFEEVDAFMGGYSLKLRIHKEADEDMECFQEDSVCENDPPRMSGGASANCLCTHNAYNFQMPPNGCDGTVQPFSVRMGGCGTYAQKNVTVVPPCCRATENTEDGCGVDPNRDFYILRVEKKHTKQEKKSNIQVHLCTPKKPDALVAAENIKSESKDAQWDADDAKEAAAKTQSEKGGKIKDKAKGKGKGKGKK